MGKFRRRVLETALKAESDEHVRKVISRYLLIAGIAFIALCFLESFGIDSN